MTRMRRSMLAAALAAAACSSDHVGSGPVASRLAFTTQPTAATAGVIITPGIQVAALDDGGAVVTPFTGTITIALQSNPGLATLSGTLTQGAVGGVATFSDLRLNRTGSGFTFSASSGGLTAATSTAFAISPAPVQQLAFLVQPTDVVAGTPIAPALQVQGLDSLGNLTPSFVGSVTLALTANGTGAVLAGTTTVSAVAGVAAFPGLHVDKSGAAYTVQATAGALSGGGGGATSASFNVSAAAAAVLAFTSQPSGAAAGTAMAPPVQVSARDAFGNPATAFVASVTLSIGANPGGGVLSGTNPVAAVSGVASFGDLSLSKSGGYTLIAAATGLAGDTSAPFTIGVGGVSGSQTTVLAAPTALTASNGSSAATITVTAKDSLGNPISGATVVLAATGSGNTLTQPAGPTDGSGTTTGHLSSTVAGSKIVSATIGVVAVTRTDTVTVTPAATASLGFTVQPTTTVATAPISPAVQVTATDAFGNPAVGFAGTVTIAIGTNPAGGIVSGTLTAVAGSGVATFPNLKIDKAGAGYTLVAISGALGQGTSQSFTISVGLPTKLVFAVQPANAGAGATITPAVQVAVQDAGGNLVTTASHSVALAIGTNAGGGTLSGTNPVSAAGGIAQFSNLSIDKSGTGYTLQATAGGLTTAVSSPFTITSGTADHLAFFVQPSDAAAGAAIAPAVKVTVLDAIGNVVTSSAASVTVAILDNPNGGTLSGAATVSASGGVATFSNLSINKSGTGYTLAASATGLPGDTSTDFSITPAGAARASFFVEPVATTAGDAITPSVQAEILDAFGNRVPTAANAVTMSLAANPGSGTLSGTLTRNASAGLATFNDLSIDKAANGYKLRASAGLAPDTSVAFNITPGTATTLAFTVPPTQTAATAAIAPAVQVTARDAQGNTATGFTGPVLMAIANNAGGGTLTGTLSANAMAGVATFANLHIDKVGTGYTLRATAAGLSTTSNPFDIINGPATKLAFLTQPVGTTGGATLAQVQVELQDAGGNRVASATNPVTVAIASDPNSGALSGSKTQTPSSGIASFTNLSIDSAGTPYTLAASAGGLTGATSTPFAITVGPAVKVGFLVPPSNAAPGAAFSPTVAVEVRDLGGNRVNSSALVTLAIVANPGGGALVGDTTINAVNGLASFPGVGITNAGTGYTIVASAPGVASTTSAAFDIAVGSGVKLAFRPIPSSASGGAAISPAVQVEVQDAAGNLVTIATNSVTLGIANNANSGTLSGTKTVVAVSGVATFSAVRIDSAGAGYTLSAGASGLTGATSGPITITVGPAAKLGFHVPPSNTPGGGAISPAVQVEVEDLGGNRVIGATHNVTVSLATNPRSGTLSGTLAVNAASGIATFSTLSIDSAGTGYRLAAAATGLTGATSPTFNITVGPATQLGYSVQPTDVTAGTSIAPAVKVEIRDAAGNRVTTASNTVGIAIGTNPGGGALSGTTSRAASNGVATFSNLSIDKIGVGYTLAATSGALTSATSTAFTVTADGVSASLSTLVSSADTVGQCTFSCSLTFQKSTVTVTVKDQFGNLVAGSPVVVAANGSGNVFSPSGSGTSDASGVFTTTYNASVVEGKTLSATAGGTGLAATATLAVMPVLVGAGDIADCNQTGDDATAGQLDSIPGIVFADGDDAYPNGTATNFTSCYDPTWGRHKARTKPVIGNHEYDSSGTAAGYFAYFGPAAADPLGNGFGYYSYDLGAWHIVVLNSDSGVTSPSSNQLTWLQNDLVGRTNQCVLALWHRPVFTSGSSGGASSKVRRLWQALENAGAEVVINGHDHLYERFAVQDSLGVATAAGIREFIVGTGGGEAHTNYVNSPANVEASDGPTKATYSRGVLRLTLYPNVYRWEFLAAHGFGTYTDSGTGNCH